MRNVNSPARSMTTRRPNASARRPRTLKAVTKVFRFALIAMLVFQGFAFSPAKAATIKTKNNAATTTTTTATTRQQAGSTVYPTSRQVEVAPPVNVRQAARQEALAPEQATPSEIRAIDAPKGEPPPHGGVPIANVGGEESPMTVGVADAPVASTTGTSPGPTKGFKGEFLSGTTIPPDTHGAVGTTHVVTVSNDRMRIQTRDGVELSRVTMTSFWAGSTVKGAPVTSAFDTKALFDRFNNRFIVISSLNGANINSGAGLAVSQTADPTGTWNRYTVASDPTSTATAGHAIDYPSVGFNKNWIVIDENTFNYSGTSFTSYYGSQNFVFDKQAAYAGTLSAVSLFEGQVSTCLNDSTAATNLACAFTLAPSVVEDNTTDTLYMVEDWDSTAGQLRLAKITGTPAAPVLTVGTQFPQSLNSWRFNAPRIGTSGGYAPQRQQSAHLPSGQRIMTNDSRIQNAVYRAGTLWTTHTVMVAATPTLANVAVGGAVNPDIRSAVQWWQIDPTIETGLSTAPLQRARIEDPTADNCHNGSAGTRADVTCNSTALQKGEFFAFPNISVNQNNDVLIGFTKFSSLTYPNAAYAFRASADPANTTRDPAIYRPGQANYNLGAGTGNTTARQNRWGDYSASQTDPLNDTDFWTVQEYAGTVTPLGSPTGPLVGTWETWWSQIKPSTAAPSKLGNLIISEFRLRGPQGVRDEYVELYNPDTVPVVVNVADNSEGWALAHSNNTTGAITTFAVVPNGTVIPAKGHFLVVDNPDAGAGGGPTATYSLNAAPNVQPTVPAGVRGADSDTGWSLDLADNGGIAIFKTSTPANFSAATRMDSAGFSSVTINPLFKEGTGIPDITGAPTGQITFHRNLVSGAPKDTNDNATDFIFVDTAATTEALGVQPRLGAPGPENLDSPINRFNQLPVFLIDRGLLASSAPNRVRDSSPYTDTLTPTTENGGLYPLGTLAIRRRLINVTGGPVTRLRFRIVDVTTFPQPVGTADVRALTSPNITVTTNDAGFCAPASAPCSLNLIGTTLEQPPTQGAAGGLDSSLSVGTVTFATPLPNNGAVDVQFLLGVRQSGGYRFFVTIEALP